MSITKEHVLAVCTLMDAQLTSAEFDAAIARNKLLYDCKKKGFKHLESIGHHCGGINQAKNKSKPNCSPLEFAKLATRLIQDGMSLKEATERFGRNAGDLKYYCRKFGIEYKPKFKKKQWDYEKTYLKIRILINEKGYRLKDVAKKLDTSPKLITNIIKSKGRRYNAKKIKVERIKNHE